MLSLYKGCFFCQYWSLTHIYNDESAREPGEEKKKKQRHHLNYDAEEPGIFFFGLSFRKKRKLHER